MNIVDFVLLDIMKGILSYIIKSLLSKHVPVQITFTGNISAISIYYFYYYNYCYYYCFYSLMNIFINN